MLDPSFSAQIIPNTSDNIREYQLNVDRHEDLKTTAGGAAFTSPHKGPYGSSSSSSELNVHITSDCSGQHRVSVHQGIMRGSHMFIHHFMTFSLSYQK